MGNIFQQAASGGEKLFNDLSGVGGIEDDQREYARYLSRIKGISIPEAQKVIVDNPKLMGELAPLLEREKAEQAGPSAMEGITTDPRFAQAQVDALSQMQEVGREGMTAQDKLALAQIQQRQGRDSAARQQAILQSMAQRGMGGAGQELAARLSAEQSGADTAAMQGMQVAADKRARALQAMQQSGQMAGNIRGQEFGEKSAAAQAKDAINRFNTQMRAGVNERNALARNQALGIDLEAGQALENQRSANENARQDRQWERDVTKSQLEMQKGGMQQPGGFGAQKAQAKSQMIGNIMKGGADIAKGFAGS